jgi:hypothetical protein
LYLLEKRQMGLVDAIQHPVRVVAIITGTLMSLLEFRIGLSVLVLGSINGILAKNPAARITLRQLVLAHGVVSTTKAGGL